MDLEADVFTGQMPLLSPNQSTDTQKALYTQNYVWTIIKQIERTLTAIPRDHEEEDIFTGRMPILSSYHPTKHCHIEGATHTKRPINDCQANG